MPKIIFNKIYVSIVFLLLISGCATSPDRQRSFIPGVSAASKDGAAVVLGQGGGLIGGVLDPTNKDIDLWAVNGQGVKESAPNREFWIVPGTYKLTIFCNVRSVMDGSGTSVRELEETLEAGHVYLLSGYFALQGPFEPAKCIITVKDVTDRVSG